MSVHADSADPSVPGEARAPHVILCQGEKPYGERFALVDAVGRLVRQPDLSSVGRFEPDGRGGRLASARDLEERWGYLDHTGRWVLEPVFDDARDFTEDGLARFRHNGLWGYVDLRGEIVIEPRFEEGGAFGQGLAAVGTAGALSYIDRSGAVVLPGPFKAAEPFSAFGLAAVIPGGVYASRDRYGFIDTSGTLVIKPRFQEHREFGRLAMREFGPDGVAPVKTGDETWVLIDRHDKRVGHTTYRYLSDFNDAGLAYCNHRNTNGYVNARGDIVISSASRDRPCGLVRDDDYDYRDATGAVALAGKGRFVWAGDFGPCGAAIAKEGGSWGVLRTDGRFLPVPHLEPDADWEGRVYGFSGGRGVAPFITVDRQFVFVDADGRDVCRVEIPERDRSALRIRSADGCVVWEERAEPGTFGPAVAMIGSGPAAHFDVPEAWDGDIVAIAESLIAAEPREFRGGDRDLYDLSELDEGDLEDVNTGAAVVLASNYVDEMVLGEFRFLTDECHESFAHYQEVLAGRLSARFGEPSQDKSPRFGDYHTTVWRVGDGRLVLQGAESGGCHLEAQLWLAHVVAELPEDEE